MKLIIVFLVAAPLAVGSASAMGSALSNNGGLALSTDAKECEKLALTYPMEDNDPCGDDRPLNKECLAKIVKWNHAGQAVMADCLAALKEH